MGYSLKNASHRKYAYVLFCVIVFDYLLFPLPIFAQGLDTGNQCIPEVLSADKSVNQSLVIENTIAEAKKQPVVAATTSDTDKKKIVRAAVLEKASEPTVVVIATSTGTTSLKIRDHGFHSMTAYTSEVAQTDASPCITANGFNVCKHGVEDTIAANFLPFGTKVRIPDMFGDRIFVVRDRMNRRYTERVDVWFKSKPAAMKFGVRTLRIEIVE